MSVDDGLKLYLYSLLERRPASLSLSRLSLRPLDPPGILVSYSRLLQYLSPQLNDEVGNNDDAVESSAAGGDSLAGSHELPSSGGLLFLPPEQE